MINVLFGEVGFGAVAECCGAGGGAAADVVVGAVALNLYKNITHSICFV